MDFQTHRPKDYGFPGTNGTHANGATDTYVDVCQVGKSNNFPVSNPCLWQTPLANQLSQLNFLKTKP